MLTNLRAWCHFRSHLLIILILFRNHLKHFPSFTHSFNSHWHLHFVGNDLERLSFLCQRRFLYFFWFPICLDIMWLSHPFTFYLNNKPNYFRLRQTDARTDIVTSSAFDGAKKVVSMICWSHLRVLKSYSPHHSWLHKCLFESCTQTLTQHSLVKWRIGASNLGHKYETQCLLSSWLIYPHCCWCMWDRKHCQDPWSWGLLSASAICGDIPWTWHWTIPLSA